MEQSIEADRLRVSQPLQKRQSRRHAVGGLIPPFHRNIIQPYNQPGLNELSYIAIHDIKAYTFAY